MARYDAFVHEGRKYDRDSFRVLLKQQMQAARDDKTHPFSDSNHANHAVAVREMQLAYRWLGGEMDDAEETSVAATFNEALQAQEGNSMADSNTGLDDLHKANQLRELPEGKIAMQRHRAGQPLTEQQRELVTDILELEASYSAQAERDRPKNAGGWTSTKRPEFIAPELYKIERLSDPREKLNAIRAQRSAWRDDPKSAFNDVNHGDHKSAISWMDRLYQVENDLAPASEGDE